MSSQSPSKRAKPRHRRSTAILSPTDTSAQSVAKHRNCEPDANETADDADDDQAFGRNLLRICNEVDKRQHLTRMSSATAGGTERKLQYVY